MADGKAGFHKGTKAKSLTRQKSGFKRGKSAEPERPAQPPKQAITMSTPLACPQCNSRRIWKDGLRYPRSNQGSAVQRWLCRECAYRFLDPNFKQLQKAFNGSDMSEHIQRILTKKLKTKTAILSYCRVSNDPAGRVSTGQPRLVQNLAEVETRQEKAAGATKTDQATVKGKVIDFLWWMEKQNYAKETIRGYGSCLRALLHRNADLFDPESVKEALAREKTWSQNRHRNVINAYTLFLRFSGLSWEKPRCKVTRKIPFIPMEQEIDDLIAGSSRKVAAFLQLLKETAMRSGEAKRLLWTDIDFERRLITLNQPEKNSLPRIWRVSTRLLQMLNALPKKSLKVFGDGPINSIKSTFIKGRRRLASKLQNPRLLQIHFHTLRHWKATMEYHRTKDILHVKAFLGHKKLDNVAIYVHLDQKLFIDTDEGFTCRVAHNVGEAIALIETGFEYVTGEYTDGGKLFRKRK